MHRAAHRQHHARRPVIGAAAAVLADPPAKLRERQHERVVQQAKVSHVVVERRQPVVERRHQPGVRAAVGRRPLRRVRVEAAGLHPEHARPDALRHRAGNGAQRLAESIVRIRNARLVLADRRHAIERGERRLRRRADERDVRLVDRHMRRDVDRRALLERCFGARVGAVECVRRNIRNRRDRHACHQQRVRRIAGGIPRRERIERRRKRGQVPSHPSVADRAGWICRRPDVGAREMRTARVLVTGALNQRQPALVEDVAQAGQLRMQAERLAARIGADLQDGARGNRERRPLAVVRGVGVRHEHAEPVVPAGQIEDDEVAAARALRAREIREKRRRGEAERERRHAVFDEVASRHHENWYSGEPRIKWARPPLFDSSCESDSVDETPLDA